MRLPHVTVPPPLYLLLAGVLGWSGLWWQGIEAFDQRVERLRGDLVAAGFSLSSDAVSYGGFPYRFIAETTDLRVEHPSGVWFAAPRVRLTTLPLQERHMVLEAGRESRAGLEAGEVSWPEGLRLGWQPTAHGAGLDVGLSANKTHIEQSSSALGVVTGLRIEAAPAPASTTAGEAPDRSPTLRWVVRWEGAKDLRLPSEWSWLGPQAGPLFAAGEVPEAARLAGGVSLGKLPVRMLGLEVMWGPLDATGAGAWRPGEGLMLELRAARSEALAAALPTDGPVRLTPTGPAEPDGRTPHLLSWQP
jgi:hypothetical protein